MKNILQGLRLAIAIVLGLPFILFLFPMFVVHIFIERRAGRPLPFDFVAMVSKAFSRQKQGFSPPPLSTFPPPPAHDATEQAPPPPIHSKDWEFAKDEGKVGGIALITCGPCLLGEELSVTLAGLGYKVGVGYHHDKTVADNIITRIRQAGGVAYPLFLDIGNPALIKNFLLEAEQLLGGIPGLLIHNTAYFHPTRHQEPLWEAMEAVFRMNVQGPLWLSSLVASQMLGSGGGQIIHVCDMYSEQPLKGYAAYSTARSGLIMANQSLSLEFGPKVRVNAIVHAMAPSSETDRGIQQPKNTTSVINAIRYLLIAHEITGEIMHVDGGYQRNHPRL
ncbi:MAG: SDR family NAD(P)-dependent oxidoreductase [Magnetococcales bacterium]|nr:SDR family NAD(P)-dependent oxidoreductase [Magnetococcales bacterium]